MTRHSYEALRRALQFSERADLLEVFQVLAWHIGTLSDCRLTVVVEHHRDDEVHHHKIAQDLVRDEEKWSDDATTAATVTYDNESLTASGDFHITNCATVAEKGDVPGSPSQLRQRPLEQSCMIAFQFSPDEILSRSTAHQARTFREIRGRGISQT